MTEVPPLLPDFNESHVQFAFTLKEQEMENSTAKFCKKLRNCQHWNPCVPPEMG